MAFDAITYAKSSKYTDQSIEGIVGVLAGKNCTIKSQMHQNGRNTIVFGWTADNGDERETTMIVLDGTPIYVWTSGDHYEYGDLVIYASCFYRCITPNDDIVFDDTKWNEIGSPDGNYDIVQNSELLPAIFTAADRKMYFSIEDGLFYLWNGYNWILQSPKWDSITGKPTIPSKTSDLTNDSNFVSDASYVHTDNNYDATAKGIVDGVSTALDGKVDKVTGKGLSTNDYSNADKSIVDGVTTALNGKVDKNGTDSLMTAEEHTKLSGIATGAEVNVQSDWNESDSTSDAYIANKPSIPSKTSDLTNDSGFITNTVNNLVNYYTKTQTYTQAEVDALISAVVSLDIKVVATLPTTNISTTTIYLVPSVDPQAQNIKDEYINIDGTTAGWELIGSTAIDLSDYVTDEDLTTALANYTTTADLTTLLSGKQDTISDLATIRSGASAGATAYQKPSTGIPKTDLASAVQTSLGKADTAIQDISGKADKVSSATNNNFAALDANGNLKDSGHKHSDYLTSHQDISGKADKVSGATNGNVATLDANGNLVDSGKTLGKSVPSNAVFTDTNDAVAQTKTTGNSDYEVLFSGTADNTTRTEGSRKNNNLKFNPSTGNLQATQLNGVTIGASPKFTDTTYESKSASSGGTAVSLCTTGEKYTWNGKADKAVPSASGNVATLDANGNLTDSGKTLGKSVPSNAVFTDTKNTAGSTDSSSKLFLVGATSQAANPQTYSQDTAYVGTDGNLYSGSKVVATQNMIGDAWVTSHAYAVGDYCIDGNVLYKCKTAHTSSASNRPPYASYWDVVSVASEIKAVDTYDEGEHEIGTFLGKKLYRRVFKVDVNMPYAQLVTYDPQFTVTGYATSIRGICYLSALNTYVTSDSYPAISTSYNGDHVFTLFQNATSGSFACKAIVIEYTKEKWN